MMPEKRKSAFLRATQEAQTQPVAPPTTSTVAPLSGSTPTPSHVESVAQQQREEVPTSERETVKKQEKKKVSFYLDQQHEDKLDELELEFRLRYKQKVNRNDIVRLLIEQCSMDSLLDLLEKD